MSKLQEYAKQIGQKKWLELEDFVQKINDMAGNDTVRIVLGDEKAIFYNGTGEKIASGIENATIMYDYEPDMFEHLKDAVAMAFDSGESEWKDVLLSAIVDCDEVGAWPKSWNGSADRFSALVRTSVETKRYAYSYDGWIALVDAISDTTLRYHGRRVKDVLE